MSDPIDGVSGTSRSAAIFFSMTSPVSEAGLDEPDAGSADGTKLQAIALLLKIIAELLRQYGHGDEADDGCGAAGGAPPAGPQAPQPPSAPSGSGPAANGASGASAPGEVGKTAAAPSVGGAGAATGAFSTQPQQGQLSDAEGKQMAVNVAHRLMNDFGLTKEQAAGVAGNLWHESAGMNSNVNEIGSDPNSPTYGAPNSTQFGYGWAQWTGNRKDDFLAFSKANGLDPASPAANYAMLANELQNSESGTLPELKKAQTPEDAATTFRSVFERAANPVDEKRMQAAAEIYALM